MQNYTVHNYSPNYLESTLWFDPTENYNIKKRKTTGAFGGPPRRKDLQKRMAKFNKAARSNKVSIHDLHNYYPTFKKWKPGKDFNPIY